MNFVWLRVAAALLGAGALAWEDRRTGFMDSTALYSLILFGALINFLEFDVGLAFAVFAPFAFIMAAGGFLSRSNQFGAGDVYLFGALQLLLPFHPFGSVWVVPFIAGVFVVAGLTALLFNGFGWGSVRFGPYAFAGLVICLLI